MIPGQPGKDPPRQEGTAPAAEKASFGERLLPYLFGAMEACLVSSLFVWLELEKKWQEI